MKTLFLLSFNKKLLLVGFIFIFFCTISNQMGALQIDHILSRDSNIRWKRNPRAIYNLLKGKGITVHDAIKYDKKKQCELDLLLPRNIKKVTSVPVVILFHGGGFIKGTRYQAAGRFKDEIRRFLGNGFAIALVDYPLMKLNDNAMNTLQCITQAARSIQFLRHNAKKYKLNPNKFVVAGSSAGAGITLYLATNELKDANAENPVYRESSKINVAGLFNGQMGYNFSDWEKYFNLRLKYEPKIVAQMRFHYNVKNINSDEAKELKKKLAFQEQLSKKFTPPLFLFCSTDEKVSTNLNKLNNLIHHVTHLKVLALKARTQQIPYQLVIKKTRCADNKQPTNFVQFAIKYLK